MRIQLLKNDPYGSAICKFFAMTFPKSIKATGKQLLDILTIIIVGDKDLRYGPSPAPEQLVVIRKTIMDAMDLNVPIPVLVPWGGRKMYKHLKLDVAEISAIRQLLRVDEAVRAFYPAGLDINIAIEDLGAELLYRETEGIEEYSSSLQKMIEMLKGDTSMKGIRESELMDIDAYRSATGVFSKYLNEVLMQQMLTPDVDVDILPAFQELTRLGWTGKIPAEQRNYYLDRYKVMEPGKTEAHYIQKLADYFAGSKARYALNGRGNPASKVDSYIKLSFVNPIPGAPASMFNNTLYYRTVDMKDGKTHIAPWRSKGFLEIQSDGRAKVKVTSWGNKDVIDQLIDAQVSITEGNDTVIVCAEYLLKDSVPEMIPVMM